MQNNNSVTLQTIAGYRFSPGVGFHVVAVIVSSAYSCIADYQVHVALKPAPA
jgi:hypothetical protein